MAYSEQVIDHYENPRNVGKMDADDPHVGTGMVGAPACGDVMRLQIKVSDEGVIEVCTLQDLRLRSAICIQLSGDRVGQGDDTGSGIRAEKLSYCRRVALPPVKIHCSVLAEDAIKAAVEDYRKKQQK